MNNLQINEHSASATSDEGQQSLTFILSGEEYGVDILRVQEIRGWSRPTPIPNSPAYVKGVINLRGTIVPIIDLRRRFGMEEREYGPTTVVIVLRVCHENGERVMGVVVDAVSEVYTIQTENLRSMPDMGGQQTRRFVRALATIDEKMIILLDIDALLNTTAELELPEPVAA